MKKIIYASGLLALMAAATSCDKYDIYPEQYSDIMMIKDAGEKQVTVYSSDDAAPYYISVIKGGHDPEKVGTATLRVMTAEDFGAYKEQFYGNSEFEGLQPLDPTYYHMVDADGKEVATNSITHTFTGSDDRYFGASIILDAQKISDWRTDLDYWANTSVADLMKENEGMTEDEVTTKRTEAQNQLNNYTFVVPVGLYSANDSVSSDNYCVMLQPVVKDPVISINIEHGGYQITEISRTSLTQDPAYRAGLFQPEVKLSIPCKNPTGFKIKLTSNSALVSTFNGAHSDMQLKNISNKKNEPRKFGLGKMVVEGTETTYTDENMVEFPAGVTEVRLPLDIFLSQVNADDLASNNALGIQLTPANERYYNVEDGNDELITTGRPTAGRTYYSSQVMWPSHEELQAAGNDIDDKIYRKIKKSLKLPTPTDETYKSTGSGYTFFVGYKVVETPLELDESCVTSNDCEPTEGSIGALFDHDLSTFFHSGWTVAFERSAPFASYLEIEVPSNTPINACYFQFTARVIANPKAPKEVDLYYSNESDPQLRENEDAWHKFATVKLKKKLGSGETGELGSLENMATAPETFKYLRFCVMTNSDDQSLTTASTSIYWNLAELVMYGKYIDTKAAANTGSVETEE